MFGIAELVQVWFSQNSPSTSYCTLISFVSEILPHSSSRKHQRL